MSANKIDANNNKEYEHEDNTTPTDDERRSSCSSGSSVEGGLLLFFCMGPSSFLFSLCPFLETCDLLSLRGTCRQAFHILHHQEHDSEEFWKLLLERDFGLQRQHQQQGAATTNHESLSVEPIVSGVSSLFGVDIWQRPDDVIVKNTTAFECWKHWNKVRARFFLTRPTGDFGDPAQVDTSQQSPSSSPSSGRRDGLRLRAAYFLRAAKIWQRISRWCGGSRSREDDDSQRLDDDSEIQRLFRAFLPTTFSQARGMSHLDWYPAPFFRRHANGGGMDACHALFSFSRGQMYEDRPPPPPHGGLLGGYEAYGYSSNVALLYFSAQLQPHPHVVVAFDLPSSLTGLWKEFRVNAQTGALDCCVHRAPQPRHHQSDGDGISAVLNLDPNRQSPHDDLLLWLEEHLRRLETGEIRVQQGTDPNNREAEPEITLYPQFPRHSQPVLTTNTISMVSRAVTQGVQVIGSAVYVPQARNRFGFIYSIRIRLLVPGEIGYLAPSERGFTTCQLLSRHWRITNHVTGLTDQVNGEAVIGMYPILHEGGYTLLDNNHHNGIFQYQSCTGPMARGQFGGYLRFVPGTLRHPTGPPFDVTLNPFLLQDEPTFLY